MKKLHALLGGTFDPVHYGHLIPALSLVKELDLEQVTLMPNNIPPHRPQPEATNTQRLTMLQLAILDEPTLKIDERELQCATPSFTIETLKQLRSQTGEQQPLAFIMGQDTLLGLPDWSQWQSILDYCHLVVCRRPGYAHTFTNTQQQNWLVKHQTKKSQQLQQQTHGLIYFAHTPQLDISATEIRNRLATQQPLRDLLPIAVQRYIMEQHLYQKSCTS